jgi:hypothetical protein
MHVLHKFILYVSFITWFQIIFTYDSSCSLMLILIFLFRKDNTKNYLTVKIYYTYCIQDLTVHDCVRKIKLKQSKWKGVDMHIILLYIAFMHILYCMYYVHNYIALYILYRTNIIYNRIIMQTNGWYKYYDGVLTYFATIDGYYVWLLYVLLYYIYILLYYLI